MPVELRKRKAPPPPPAPISKRPSKAAKPAAAAAQAKEAPAPVDSGKANGAAKPSSGGKPAPGDSISLDGFGGDIETNDGDKTTLKALVDDSKSGVVLFTYPKASTPGCTTQVCLFRDSYEPLTAGGLAIYGLSSDSPKANTTFRTKQKLPYPLLCDPSATLIGAIGLKKSPKGTQRGVFVVDKAGKVLVAEPGGPAATLEAVKKLVEETGAKEEGKGQNREKDGKDDEAEDGEGVKEAKKEAEEKSDDKAEDKKDDKAEDKKDDEADEKADKAEEKAEEKAEGGKEANGDGGKEK